MCQLPCLTLFGLLRGGGGGGGGSRGQRVLSLTLIVNNFFNIEANATKLGDFSYN